MYLKFLLVAHTTQVTLYWTWYIILCVILLWPTKIKSLLILMQNMFNVWDLRFRDKLIENFVFGRSGLNSRVFEKLFISYSCILFIMQCVLRSFCIKMLSFSENLFFQIFDWSNLLLERSKLRLKILVWICLARLMLD